MTRPVKKSHWTLSNLFEPHAVVEIPFFGNLWLKVSFFDGDDVLANVAAEHNHLQGVAPEQREP